jgi:excisionase family DNA binding protein
VKHRQFKRGSSPDEATATLFNGRTVYRAGILLPSQSEAGLRHHYRWRRMETSAPSPPSQATVAKPERLAYSIRESAELLGVDYFSVYRLIQRGKLRACRALRGKLLVPRSEILRLLEK